MIDIKLIRESPELIKKSIKERNYDINLEEVIKLDKQ
ncbi:MAG: hypothetical protein Q8L27_02045, partial [archaeon]|nr:hypothetical protein [archaeon]